MRGSFTGTVDGGKQNGAPISTLELASGASIGTLNGLGSQFTDFTSSPFTINTAAPSRDSALLGFGATATFDNSLTLYLNYLADVALGTQDNFSQTVVGGIKAQF